MTLNPPRIGPISGSGPIRLASPPPPAALCPFPNGLNTTGIIPVGGTCTTDIAATTNTGTINDTSGFGPVSIPVSAAPYPNAQQICFFYYVGPLMGLGGCIPLVISNGWSTLDISSNNGDSGWGAVGHLYQPAIATPPNMNVSASCSGGGAPVYFGVSFAFPSVSVNPVQQSPLTGSGNAILPSTPTPGNILVCWMLASISGSDTTQWIADGGTILVNNTSHNGGQWFLCVGIRCVKVGDTTTIRIPAGSHANFGAVSEWLP